MSKHETPLTRRYWSEVGGTLIEEFLAVSASNDQGRRLIDGVIIKSDVSEIRRSRDIDLQGKDIVVVQTKASRLGMSLLGQVLFSMDLMKAFRPASIEGVAICTQGDATMEKLAADYGIRVVVFD